MSRQQGYTAEELRQMGATPNTPAGPGTSGGQSGRSFTAEELRRLGATPGVSQTHQQPGPSITEPQGGNPLDSFLSSLKSALMPDWRDASRIGGATVGGAIGSAVPGAGTIIGAAVGGGLGAMAGDAAYQILQMFGAIGEGEMPQEADLGGIQESFYQGAVQEALVPAATRGVIEPAERFAQRGLENRTISALDPSGKVEKASARRVAPGMSQEMGFAYSADDLERQVRNGVARSNRALDQAYGAIDPNTRIVSADILSTLRSQRGQFVDPSGKVIPGNEASARVYDQLIDFFTRNKDPKIGEIRRYRGLWDNIVNWGRRGVPGTSQPAREEAFETAANLIRNEINSAYPDVADANRAFNMWNQAKTIVESADLRHTNAPFGNWRDVLAAGLGSTAGAAAGGPGGAGTGMTAALLLRRLMNSTPWKTASVVARRKAIEALDSGGVEAAMRALMAGASGQGVQATGGEIERRMIRPSAQ